MDISGHLGGSFLANTDLPNPYQVWTISKVEEEWFGQGQSTVGKICVTFSEHQKPLAFNKTNLKRVASLYSTNSSDWIGKTLLVYLSTTTFGGETTLCVRVCGPQQAPPDPICDKEGNTVVFQPIITSPVLQPPASMPAPWESQDAQSPPSA